MERTIHCNDEQRLFVIPAGGSGWSTYGYDNCFRDAQALSEKLGKPDLAPKEEEIGTLDQYQQREQLVRLAATTDLGTWFTPGTAPEVERILEDARRSGQRLRILYGDKETGRQWDDRPSIGSIGRSMGPMKIPLLISSRRSMGGGALLTDCIIRIETSPGRKTLYRHPALQAQDATPTTEAPRIG